MSTISQNLYKMLILNALANFHPFNCYGCAIISINSWPTCTLLKYILPRSQACTFFISTTNQKTHMSKQMCTDPPQPLFLDNNVNNNNVNKQKQDWKEANSISFISILAQNHPKPLADSCLIQFMIKREMDLKSNETRILKKKKTQETLQILANNK